jgi:hypothetical protein
MDFTDLILRIPNFPLPQKTKRRGGLGAETHPHAPLYFCNTVRKRAVTRCAAVPPVLPLPPCPNAWPAPADVHTSQVGNIFVPWRQSCLPYAQSFTRGLQGARQSAGSLKTETDIVTSRGCNTVRSKKSRRADGEVLHTSHIQQKQKNNYSPHTPLTYVGMVLRQHTTLELQHPFSHRKRFLVPPDFGV